MKTICHQQLPLTFLSVACLAVGGCELAREPVTTPPSPRGATSLVPSPVDPSSAAPPPAEVAPNTEPSLVNTDGTVDAAALARTAKELSSATKDVLRWTTLLTNLGFVAKDVEQADPESIEVVDANLDADSDRESLVHLVFSRFNGAEMPARDHYFVWLDPGPAGFRVVGRLKESASSYQSLDENINDVARLSMKVESVHDGRFDDVVIVLSVTSGWPEQTPGPVGWSGKLTDTATVVTIERGKLEVMAKVRSTIDLKIPSSKMDKAIAADSTGPFSPDITSGLPPRVIFEGAQFPRRIHVRDASGKPTRILAFDDAGRNYK